MRIFQKLFNQPPSLMPLSALTWVNELKGMDEIAAIEHATAQLNIGSKNNRFQDDQCLDALFAADEKTRIIVEKVTSHYLHIENISIELEERMANAVFLYHRQLFLIYATLIDNLAPAEPESLALMLARAINSATEMIKWRYYNYQSAPANVWHQISKLYVIAEKKSLLEKYLQTYQDQEATTLSSLYIQACMLGSLESLSFKRQQIELVSKMLANWTPKILIQTVFDENKHLFYIDTASDNAARRIRNFKPVASCRYWCFDSINSKIELCLSMIEFNIQPKHKFMLEVIQHKYVSSTLEILRTEWSRVEYKRQRRAFERVKVANVATTTFGFDPTCAHVQQHANIQIKRGEKHYQGNKSFDERLASHQVTKDFSEPNIIYFDLGAGECSVVDESTNGLGLNISKQASEVTLGMMIGVSIQGQKSDTKIGIIRSIKPIIGNELHIGVEMLSKTGHCVEVKNVSRVAFKPAAVESPSNNNGFANTVSFYKRDFADTASFNTQTPSFTCLYLPKEFSSCKQDTLVVPRLHYNKNDAYKVNLLGNELVIKFTEALEHHENWLQVAFIQENALK